MMEFELSNEERIFLDTLSNILEKELKPIAKEIDSNRKEIYGVFKKLGDHGFLGLLNSEKYGGANASMKIAVLAAEQIGKNDPSLATAVLFLLNTAWSTIVEKYGKEEGTVFRLYEPILSVRGPYGEFGIYEPIIDGIFRHNISIATKAARCKILAMSKTIIFFGIRALHPAISPMADRAAYIGGCDAVSGVLGAKIIGEKPIGTMPHELTLLFDDVKDAWKAFDEVIEEDVPRIMLCDTMYDERTEVLMAAQLLKERLAGVRIDTPASRRGDIRKLLQEIRWILDMNGLKETKIVLSSGVDENVILQTRDLVDIYGIGTSISFPPSIDLAFDIVEKEGKPYSKRGKLPGRKQVYRCKNCFNDEIKLFNDPPPEKCPKCGGNMDALLKKYIENGKIIREVKSEKEVKNYVLNQLKVISTLT